MVVRLKLKPPDLDSEPVLFLWQANPGPRFWAAFAGSCAAHGAVVVAAVAYSILQGAFVDVPAFPKYAVIQPIELHLPASQKLIAPAPPARAVAQKARSTVRIAAIPVPRQSKVVLLQPLDLPARVVPVLPPMIFWGADHLLPSQRTLVVPEQLPPMPELPRLSAQPSLDLPNHELNVADLKIAGPPAEHPTLPRAAATTAPIRNDQGAIRPLQSAPAGEPGGDRINLLSLGTAQAPMRGRLLIPPGNQGVQLDSVQIEPQAGVVIAKGSEGTDRATVADSGKGAGTTNAAPAVAEVLPARISRPRDGNFEIVVVQSGVSETVPNSAELLSGRPVYTVYVKVDPAREWIMQYCLPKDSDQSVRVSGAVVSLGSASPIRPPYPYLIVGPVLSPGPMTIHGFISTAGKLERLKAVGDITSSDRDALLAALAEWEFRPAERDGVAIAVEILLVIPRRT
ncbi:MAG: hypothetical protein LAO79_18775 [Acidobacteriia bacterium]|nr:hypothetical protein [Terriglobia bacterium]